MRVVFTDSGLDSRLHAQVTQFNRLVRHGDDVVQFSPYLTEEIRDTIRP